MPGFQIRPLAPDDFDWVRRVVVTEWSAEMVIAHNEVFHPTDLPGFVAFAGEEPVGLLTNNLAGDEFEIVTLDLLSTERGVGTALIEAARQAAGRAGCTQLFLVTTNNNTHALRYFQKRGFLIAVVRLKALEKSRHLKPEIPLADKDGPSIRDEIELEINLEKLPSPPFFFFF